MKTFYGVLAPGDAAGTYWPQISRLVEEAMPYAKGEHELDDVRLSLMRGETIAIASVEGDDVAFVLICSLVETPRKRILYIQYGAGYDSLELKDTLVEVARTLHIDWVETRCRASIARLFRKIGFDIGYYTPILEIDYEHQQA